MLKRDPILSSVLCMLMSYPCAYCVTEVYNLRVATLTSEQIDLEESVGTKHSSAIFSSQLIMRTRQNKRGDDQLLVADVSNLIYSYKNFYARADTGFGYVRETMKNITTKHPQLDDILLSVGYRHTINPQVFLAYTVVGGIPTHKDVGVQYFQFGTGHYALGGQIDAILKRGTYCWITAARLVHFFKAKAKHKLNYTCLSVDFALGNLGDLILAFYKKIGKNHSIEIGYNPTFNFNVYTKPPLDPVIPNYTIRNSWYSIYRYSFAAHGYPMGIGLSASYGFDIAPQLEISTKRNISCWVSYIISF